MLFSEEYVSESDKIDRIYRMLRSERRARIFKTFVKIAVIGLIVYGYFYINDPANEEVRTKIVTTVQTKLMELMLPVISSMIQNIQTPGQLPTVPPTNINPAMIKAIQDSMQK